MIFIELFKQAFDSLKANKLRLFLTMLGIAMGVFSVIAIMAIGNATESYIAGELKKSRKYIYNIIIAGMINKKEWLTLEDIDLIIDNIPK